MLSAWQQRTIGLMRLNASSDYFDRKGDSITVWQWSHLWEDDAYRIVSETKVGNYTIKTFWTGLGFCMYFGAPTIFETRILGPKGNPWLHYDAKYQTEENALEGHKKICEMIRSTYAIPKNDTTILEHEI